MIRMRSSEGQMVPLVPAQVGRWVVLLATLAAICLFSWSMRPAHSSGAVVRVSLAKVPEERVVTFGHADQPFAMVLPVPVENEPEAPQLPQTRATPGTQLSSERPAQRFATSPAPKMKPDANGVLPIGFSLPKGVSSETGGVGVAKTLASETGAATGLTIFLIGGAVIEVDRNELVSALAQLGAADRAGSLPAAGETGRLSLDRVRTAGVDLRYDAIQDRLVLRP